MSAYTSIRVQPDCATCRVAARLGIQATRAPRSNKRPPPCCAQGRPRVRARSPLLTVAPRKKATRAHSKGMGRLLLRCFVAAAALAAVCSAEEAKAEEAATEAQPEAAATEGAEAAAEPEPVVLNCNANGEQLRGPPARARVLPHHPGSSSPAELIDKVETWSIDCVAQWLENLGFRALATGL